MRRRMNIVLIMFRLFAANKFARGSEYKRSKMSTFKDNANFVSCLKLLDKIFKQNIYHKCFFLFLISLTHFLKT